MIQPPPSITPAAGYAAYQPETLRAYEIGTQGWLPGNRLRYSRFRDGAADYGGNQNPLTGTGRVYLDAANRYSRNGHGVVSLAAGVTVRQLEITAYVNNLANRRDDAVGYQNGIVTVYSPPREAGVRFTWRI